MKIKKLITVFITLIVITLIGLGAYFIFFKEDKSSTLTIIEKQWIEDNKNNIIDLGIVNNIPFFNYDGKGIIFDFIKDIEGNTGLEFNKISYSINKEVPSEYSFAVTNEVDKKDILFYEDNYVLVGIKNELYDNIYEIEESNVGVLEKDLEKINYYFNENNNLSFKTYEKIEDLIQDLKDKKTINSIIIPKTVYLEDINENELYINYNIVDIPKYLVLKLGKNDKLNTIIKKYLNKWYNESYLKSYSEHFSNYYFESNNISDDSRVNFRSKQYKYGFVSHAPYDDLINGKLVGINNEIIKDFATLSNIELKYYQYKNTKELLENFNNNKLDFYFNTINNDKYDMDVLETVSIFNEDITVLSSINNKQIINSISSLKNKKIMILKNSKIEKLLKEKDIEFKGYKTLDNLLENINDNYLIVIEKEVYNTYKNNLLKNYVDVYNFNLDEDYNYVIRDIKDNEVFMNYFNFYLSFANHNEITKDVNYKLFISKNTGIIFKYIFIALIVLVIIFGSVLIIKNIKNKSNKKNQVGKENIIKYIDMLTSLKNRNYLNDSIEKWDDSEIYPQTIIIIDLNNIAYINDNYGHAEGDNIIKEAANILFKNQIENSEIMRTNGNEFLIYMVEYDEKQVVSYIRKLTREFKELSHGFGAAIGYSMINDPLKTIDDAINEATLDMRTNKEEAK